MLFPVNLRNAKILPSALGSGLLWGWSYLFFFASQSKIALAETVWSDILFAGASLLTIGLTWFLFSSRRVRTTEPLADIGCIVLVLGTVISLFFSMIPTASELYIVVGKGLSGIGQTLFWVAWFGLLARCEVGQAESSVLAWFPIGSVLLMAVSLCNLAGNSGFIVLFTLFQCGIPLASLALFRIVAASVCWQPDNAANKVPENEVRVDRSGGFRDMASIGCILALSVFSWSMFLFEQSYGFQASSGLFAAGLLIAMSLAWMALQSTRKFGPSTLLRWALPIFGAAVVFDHLTGTVHPVIPFLCFTVVNVELDAFFKLFIIHTGRRSPGNEDLIAVAGTAAFTVAAGIGSCAWTLVCTMGLTGNIPDSLLVMLLLVCITSSALLGRETDEDQDRTHRKSASGDGADTPVRQFAELTGLSTRESEVLALLLAGKSRAYIREELCISKGTVDTHVNHIYRKAGVSSRDGLMRLVEQTNARPGHEPVQPASR